MWNVSGSKSSNQQANFVDAVLVDEEAIGSVEKPGTGAKILHGMDALERYLNKLNSTDPVVRFLLLFTLVNFNQLDIFPSP